MIHKYTQGFKQIADLILSNPNKFKQHMQEKQLLDQCNVDGIQKIVVGAVINYENKCLCVKRVTDDFMGGLVELPSGGKDEGEGVVESLKREINEETGIKINDDIQFSYIDSFDYVSGSGKNARQLNYLVELTPMPNVVLNPKEHSDFYWLSAADLDQFNISEHTKNTILKSYSA
jgi:8-oxo-dGTP diphosphatase